MPKVPHPAKDFSAMFDDYERRLKALERPPGPALGSLLAKATPAQGAQVGTNSPAAPSGFGGEVILTTLNFTITRAAQVMLVCVYSGFVNVTSGPFITNDPFYFQIDGVDITEESGTLPKGEPTAATGGSFTLVSFQNLAVGAHAVSLIWNSEEGASDHLTGSGVVYALMLS